MDGFNEWIQSVTSEILVISNLLDKPLSSEPEELIQDLQKIESRHARTGVFLSKATFWVDRAKYVFMPKKGEGSDLDRKAKRDYEVATIQEYKNRIEAFHKSIQTRIGLGQSLLAYRRQSIENNKVMRTAQSW